MSWKLEDIAQQLSEPRKVKNKKTTEVEIVKQVPKTQLIYGFNGNGKTRLSREFKELIAPSKSEDDDSGQQSRAKILYYNAFTEDLFYWKNDPSADAEPRLKIQPNTFTDWILKEQGQDQNIITNFQRYANDKLMPRFNEEYVTQDKDGKDRVVAAFSEVTFSIQSGDEGKAQSLKISKGEESNFIWSVFYTLLEQVIAVLNEGEPGQRESDQFDQLKYVFIDDPVSSLDENHLIQLGVNLAELISSSSSDLKFIISTHSPLFYNVLHNELNAKTCFMLTKNEDGTFDLDEKPGDSNQSFSYHLHLKNIIEKAIADNKVEKYHFMLLRNLYEKTASFLGYKKWPELLDTVQGDKEGYLKRITHFNSHRTLAGEEVAPPTEPEKQMVGLLLKNLIDNYGFWKQGEQNG